MKYHIISDNEKLIKAFNVIGVEGDFVSETDDEQAILEKVLADGHIGTVLISKDIYGRLGKRIESHRRTGRFPVIMSLDD